MTKERLEKLNNLIKELQVVSLTKTQKSSRFISSDVYECTLNNGHIITRERLLKNNQDGSAAIIIPILSNHNFLLTVEPRVFTKRTVGLSFPAGYIEKGEDSLCAAKRELEEETGYNALEYIYLGGFYQDMGCSAAFNRVYIAKDIKKVGEQQLDKDEFVRYIELSFAEIEELIALGYIQGCNALIAFQKYKTYMKKGI